MIKKGQAESFCLMMRLQPSQLAENAFWNRKLKKSDFYFPHLNKVSLVEPNIICPENIISVFGEKAVLSESRSQGSEISTETQVDSHSSSLATKPSETSQQVNSLGKNSLSNPSKTTNVSKSNNFFLLID